MLAAVRVSLKRRFSEQPKVLAVHTEDWLMKRSYKIILSAVVATGLMAFSPSVLAEHAREAHANNGVVMHLGIIHARVLAANPTVVPKGHPIKSGKHDFHVLVSLYDHKTGQNISDALVKAKISPLTAGGVQREMHLMTSSGFVTYCNYFKMRPQVTYSIDVVVKRPDNEDATSRFIHQTAMR